MWQLGVVLRVIVGVVLAAWHHALPCDGWTQVCRMSGVPKVALNLAWVAGQLAKVGAVLLRCCLGVAQAGHSVASALLLPVPQSHAMTTTEGLL
jgi:hypothetical protein